MIQRIQSIYLLVAAVLMGVLFFVPVAAFLGDLAYYKLFITHLEYLTPDTAPVVGDAFLYPLAAVNAVIIGISILTIFQFKNRVFQIKLANVNVFLSIIFMMGLMFYYVPMVEKATTITANYIGQFGIYLPLASLVMFVLASKAIRKDEKLVRSEDRLR